MRSTDENGNRQGRVRLRRGAMGALLVATMAFPTPRVFAQEDQEPEVLLKGGDNSALFELDNKLTSVGGEFAHFIGISAGWLINHRFLIGVGGYGRTDHVSYSQMGYGGLVLEYFFDPDKLLNFSVRGLLGGGATSWAWGDPFFVGEPELKATLNITKRVRMDFGGGYRFVLGGPGWSDRLSGPVATIGLKVEAF